MPLDFEGMATRPMPSHFGANRLAWRPLADFDEASRFTLHELGIVFHIQRDLEQVALENAVGHIASVTLEMGEVSGIVPELLLDAWRWSADKKDLFRGAELVIETIPALTHCEACGCDYATLEHGKTCPSCGSGETYLIQGNEVSIKEIAVDDAEAEVGVGAGPAIETATDRGASGADPVDSANPVYMTD